MLYNGGIVFIRCSGSKYYAIEAEIRSNLVQQPYRMNRVQDIVYLYNIIMLLCGTRGGRLSRYKYVSENSSSIFWRPRSRPAAVALTRCVTVLIWRAKQTTTKSTTRAVPIKYNIIYNVHCSPSGTTAITTRQQWHRYDGEVVWRRAAKYIIYILLLLLYQQ